MTVTGHVPQAVTTMAGISGDDQINHLNYVTSMLRTPGAVGNAGDVALDLQSDAAKRAAISLDHHTVVDPTASWARWRYAR
jgi:hypothetical protein